MKRLLTTCLLILFLPISAFAEIKIVTHTVQQPFGGSQSPDDARTSGISRAKREALEKFGTYVESTTIVKNSQLDSDEILALTAGVTKVEVIKQKNYADGDAFGIEITVKVELDDAVLEKSLQRLIQDRSHLKDLKAARAREKTLLDRIAELEKQNKQKGKTKKQSDKLKKDFQAVNRELTAIDWFYKTLELWNGKSFTDINKALENVSKSISFDPNYATSYFVRGIIRTKQEQLPLAVEDFSQVIRLDPTFSVSYAKRGDAYLRLQQHDLALADYSQAIRLEPNNAAVFFTRAAIFMLKKQLKLAVADLTSAIRLSPDSMSYKGRARAYSMLKQPQLAIADYEQAIRLEPTDARNYAELGFIYDGLDNYQLAIVNYSQAINLNPKDAEVYTDRALAYLGLDQFDNAIADYNQAINLDPNNAIGYRFRGKAYLMQHQELEGCADLEKACKLGDCNSYEKARQENKCR